MDIEILIVEDNEADAYLTRLRLEELAPPPHVNVVSTGDGALRYLRKQREHVNAESPHLVLLDLNLPGISGHEVLAAIRADEGLQGLPVMILSSSRAQVDVDLAYQSCANAYIVKPTDLDGYEQLAHGITNFWAKTATLPSRAVTVP